MSTRRKKYLPQDAVERRGTIVIADQDGFTRTILERGTSAALENIWRIRRLLIPVFRHGGGEVYKVDADNLYVYFRDAEAAVAASLEAHATLARDGRRRRPREPLAVGIGIGSGSLVYLPSEDDYYGAEVNLASKLGEDTANGGETLLTIGAFNALSPHAPGRAGRLRRIRVGSRHVSFREWLAE